MIELFNQKRKIMFQLQSFTHFTVYDHKTVYILFIYIYGLLIL